MGSFDSAWYFVSSFSVFLFGLILSTRVGRFFGVPDQKGVLIYIWHSVFCLLYVSYSLSNPSDAVGYYQDSLQYQDSFGVGTKFVNLFTSIFSSYLGFSYLGCALVYNLIGYIGLVAFYGVLRKAVLNKSKNMHRLALLCVFLPSVSFWSSGIGKDALSFLAIGLALWATLNSKKGMGYLIFAFLVMVLVRPHIAAVMLGAYSVSFMFDRRVSIIPRILLGVISISFCIVVLPFAVEYAGLGDVQNSSDIGGYIDARQGSNLDGGSSIDIVSMSFPMKLFTYLCRPLPFEAHSIFAFAASLDNILLLLLILFGVQAMVKKNPSSVYANRLFLWVYLFLTWAVLAETTANLGIAMRQKWMFAPVLIFLILSILGTSNTKRVMRS